MADNLIAVTPKISMHALAFQGIMVNTCYPQIRDMLRRKFGDEYVLLFAKPVENSAEAAIDWYTPVQGAARPLASLPEAEAAPIYSHISEMAAAIAAYAEELIQTHEPLKVTRGNILKLALRYPDDKALYAVGQQPVYTCWGFGPGTPGAEGMYLTRIAPAVVAAKPVAEAAPAPAQEPPEPVPEKQPEPVPVVAGSSWLWWLWPLLAALLLFFLLFSSFGTVGPIIGDGLFHFPALPFLKTDMSNVLNTGSLASEVDALRKQAQEHAAMCKSPATQAPIVPDNAEELVIPDNPEDISFLAGQWHCETGLANAMTKEPVQVTFDFNKEGAGTGTVYEKDGICQGAAKAEIINGRLHMIVDEQRCANRTGSYGKITIDCSNSNHGATQCYGINADGSRWDATFLKLK